MLELLDVRFSFLCRTTRTNAAGKNPIIFRVNFRAQRRDVFTGLYCDKDDWDSKNQLTIKSKKDAASISEPGSDTKKGFLYF